VIGSVSASAINPRTGMAKMTPSRKDINLYTMV
jgi:hypothetical protein